MFQDKVEEHRHMGRLAFQLPQVVERPEIIWLKRGKNAKRMSLIIHKQRIYAIKNTTAFSKYVRKYSVIHVKSHSTIAMGPLYFSCRFIVREKFSVLIYITKIIYMV